MTAQLKPALVMGASVTVVTALSNFIISLLRKGIPNRIRIIVQLVVVATLVILIDQFLKAFAYDVSKQLSVYVGLIITNCIIMGRLEAFALSHGPGESFLDGLGNGLGYSLILVIVAFFRELFGSGTLLGYQVIPQSFYEAGYQNNGLMILPPMGRSSGSDGGGTPHVQGTWPCGWRKDKHRWWIARRSPHRWASRTRIVRVGNP